MLEEDSVVDKAFRLLGHGKLSLLVEMLQQNPFLIEATLVKLLIEFGADITSATSEETSLLDVAYQERAVRAAIALLMGGAKLETSAAYQNDEKARRWFELPVLLAERRLEWPLLPLSEPDFALSARLLAGDLQRGTTK